MSVAIFPGSFDPITLGHLDVIDRASRMFDRVVVCVMCNSAKQNQMFSADERVELILKAVGRYPNVEVRQSSKLLADFAREYEGSVLVKGLRDTADFVYEYQLDRINKKLNPELDTVFIPASAEYAYLSSTVAREMARYGVDLSAFIPGEIIEDTENRAKQWRT